MRFERMINNANNGGFWKERRTMNRDEASTWMITKDPEGKRIFDPKENDENIACYYEKLYSHTHIAPHPYHTLVNETVTTLSNERQEDANENENDRLPTKAEVSDTIRRKKNKKATTDWNNVMLKKGGDAMTELFMPVIKAFWKEEAPPKQWNQGTITNIWKGKGDRECMENQRGITVSGTFGTILEEILNDRITKTINYTQAQAGGRKGASTMDHVFILRNIMTLAKKEGRHMIVSFFDVKKAFDRADMNDMLFVLYKNGVQGKLWRLTRSLNTGLTAKVKTKGGVTREFKREKGGKQGGKLMVPMFSKTMDTLSEDMMSNEKLGIKLNSDVMPALIFMDDVLSFAEGYDQQKATLEAIDEFGTKHQIEWGAEKCKVMETGTHNENQKEWSLGEKTISNCRTYKYLGEIISRDGKNEENLIARFKKIKSTVRAITTCGNNMVMRRIGTKALITLHDAVTLPTLLYNSETWPLNNTIKNEIDKIEIWAWKSMLGLPKTTPTPAVIFCTGALYASTRIETRQLIYLHKVLQKDQNHWTKQSLDAISTYNIGWAKQIRETLDLWGLENDWESIKQKKSKTWKKEVYDAAENINLEKLKKDCVKKSRGENIVKTKTKTIIPHLEQAGYTRKPNSFMIDNNKLIARAYIMGRYGMLQCAANFSAGYGGKLCINCGVIDDENHRINNCERWKEINLFDCVEKVNYDDLYSDDQCKSMCIIGKIIDMWDLGNGKNAMRSSPS